VDLATWQRGRRAAIEWEAELLGPPASGTRFTDVRRLLLDLVSAPEYSLADVVGFVRGQRLSLEVLIPEAARLDLTRLGPDFHVPIFFFEGRHDPYNRPLLIQEYSRTLNAPRKEVVWFDNSGHFPFFEEQQRFTEELVRRVLPLSTDR
jgi:pimeloyl-ACP methyl ester carboxylesterase